MRFDADARPVARRSPAAAASLLLLMAASVSSAAHAQTSRHTLDVMSCNIRFDNGGFFDGFASNAWNAVSGTDRRDLVTQTILTQAPDVFGVQEARANQLNRTGGFNGLNEELPGYSYYGVGQDDGQSAGEFNAIFCDATRFSRLDQGSFWLSETPETPGTSFSQNLNPNYPSRNAGWVRLLDADSGRELVVVNTHWQNTVTEFAAAIEEDRVESGRLIQQRLQAIAPDVPVVVLGDLNATEPSGNYAAANGAAFRALAGDRNSPVPLRTPTARPSRLSIPRASGRSMASTGRSLAPGSITSSAAWTSSPLPHRSIAQASTARSRRTTTRSSQACSSTGRSRAPS